MELNRAFRDVVSSGEESRYGASKRTDLLRVGVCFAAVKVEDRELSLGVVVDVVGVWPWNCADSSSYCLRSLGSWVERVDTLFFTHQSRFFLLAFCFRSFAPTHLSPHLLLSWWENSLSKYTLLLFSLRTQRLQSRTQRLQRSRYISISLVVRRQVKRSRALTFEE